MEEQGDAELTLVNEALARLLFGTNLDQPLLEAGRERMTRALLAEGDWVEACISAGVGVEALARALMASEGRTAEIANGNLQKFLNGESGTGIIYLSDGRTTAGKRVLRDALGVKHDSELPNQVLQDFEWLEDLRGSAVHLGMVADAPAESVNLVEAVGCMI